MFRPGRLRRYCLSYTVPAAATFSAGMSGESSSPMLSPTGVPARVRRGTSWMNRVRTNATIRNGTAARKTTCNELATASMTPWWMAGGSFANAAGFPCSEVGLRCPFKADFGRSFRRFDVS